MPGDDGARLSLSLKPSIIQLVRSELQIDDDGRKKKKYAKKRPPSPTKVAITGQSYPCNYLPQTEPARLA